MMLFFTLNHKHLEILAVFQFLFVMLWAPLLCLSFSLFLLFTPLNWLVICYALWLYYDYSTPSRGSRRSQWFRRAKIWQHFVNYFPLKLSKTVDLDPGQNYLFNCHPHGILGLSVFGSFCTEAAGFSELFPGITPYPCTLRVNFWFPLRREYIMAFGITEVSRKSIEFILSAEQKGNAIVIITGGATESLESHPGKYNVVLKSRKGFVKIALQTGAQLVPVIFFGENDLFVQLPNPVGSRLRQIQENMKSIWHFALPIFHGQGIFNDIFGFMPFRKPLWTVVGAPLPVEKQEYPTKDQIDELHQKYIEALLNLFEENKSKFGIPEETKMNII